MSDNRGTPLDGDRGAFDTVNHADRHAKGIEDDTLKRHLPEPSGDGTYARDDGSNWQTQLGIPLADLLSYVRGALIAGGASDWEALAIGAADTVLKSDGTDPAWNNVGHDELTDVAADDHQDLVTLDADVDTILSLTTQVLGLDTQTANAVFAGPSSGADAVPTFRPVVNTDLPDPIAFKTAATTLTITTGAVTATQNLHVIAAETGTEDDLDTIDSLTERQFLLIQADTGDTITVKHGTGNIHFDSGADFELAGDSWLLLFYDGTNVVALGAGGVTDAADATYTPADTDDWGGSDPGNVDDALDYLASKLGHVNLLFTQTVTQEIVDTTTETNLLNAGRGSKTIPADTLQSGDVIRLRLTGQLSDTGTPSPDIRIELSDTGLASVTPTLTGVTEVDWHFDIIITCRTSGASGTFLASGLFDYDEGSEISLESAAEVTIDTTADLEVQVYWTWDVASASNDIDCRQATMEHLSVENLAPVAPTGLTATETV